MKAILYRAVLLSCLLPGLAMAAKSTGQLEKDVADLKRQNREMAERLEAVMDQVDQAGQGKGKAGAGKTRLGGYGELHLNQLSNNTTGGQDKNEIDLHRFILFVSHDFSNDVRFWSEVEIEHAKVDDKGGEVAIEQAYLEFDVSANIVARAGIMLIPVGIMNETHEPPTFYGVERNNVEKYIIPTTWREGGVGIHGRVGTLSYDVLLHSGLNTSAADDYAVRDGRTAVRNAPADNFAWTGRIKWTGLTGLELAASVQLHTDVTQGNDATAGGATLLETHLAWQRGPFALRVLYANWRLDGTGPQSVGADTQTGWYVEPSYKVTPKLGVFFRQSSRDNQANSGSDTEITQTDIGLNYWPHSDVVLKLDYQTQDVPAGANEYEGINLGVGYQF